MRRLLATGGISLVMCMVCFGTAFMVGIHTATAIAFLVFGGVFYGFAMAIAMMYAHSTEKSKDDKDH